MIRLSLSQFFAVTQHMVSNFDILLDKDKATMRALFHNPVIMRGVPWPSPFFSVGGWYKAELRREADGWKISHLSEDIAYNQCASSIVLFVLGILYLARFIYQLTSNS